jgi:thymidylate kinase
MIDIPFVSLEGTDLSGKSTLYKKLWLQIQTNNNFDVLLTDRGYFSILCYGVLYNRAPVAELEANFLRWLNKNVVIYMHHSSQTIKERFAVRSDDDRTLEEILKVRAIYELFAKKYERHPNFIFYDPQEMSESTLLHLVRCALNRSVFAWPTYLPWMVENFGSTVAGTNELTNITFESKESWENICNLDLRREDLKEIRTDWSQLEHDSYEYQTARFMRSVETVLCGYKGKKEDFKSRKFVFTDDECMSYLHILVRDDSFFVKVQFRSSDVKMLHHDLKEVVRMVKEFGQKIQLIPKDVYFSITIDSLHKY